MMENYGPRVQSDPPWVPLETVQIQSEAWENIRDFIHVHFRLGTLEYLREVTYQAFCFRASEQQWKKKFKAWGLRKNKQSKPEALRQPDQSQAAGNDRGNTVADGSTIRASEANPLTGQPSTVVSPAEFYWSLYSEALNQVEEDDYWNARPKFIKALKGMQESLTVNHENTICVLENFLDAALINEDFEGALEQLEASYALHIVHLGLVHPDTWDQLCGIGRFHQILRQFSLARPPLEAAREGLLKVIFTDPEDGHRKIQNVTVRLVEVAKGQKDFPKAEGLLRELISRAEAAGGSFASDVDLLRHELIHLYLDSGWINLSMTSSMPHPSKARVEKYLREATGVDKQKDKTDEATDRYLCSLELFLRHYYSAGMHEKADEFLSSIEKALIDVVGPPANDHIAEPGQSLLRNAFRAKKGLGSSFLHDGQYQKAELWLKSALQQKWPSSDFDDQQSQEILSTLMMLATACERQWQLDSVAKYLSYAKKIARKHLPPDHDFHRILADAKSGAMDIEGIKELFWCDTCGTNPASVQPKRCNALSVVDNEMLHNSLSGQLKATSQLESKKDVIMLDDSATDNDGSDSDEESSEGEVDHPMNEM